MVALGDATPKVAGGLAMDGAVGLHPPPCCIIISIIPCGGTVRNGAVFN